jgi:DNA-binding response OmpR family regulator
MKILIVDDEPDILDLLKQECVENGYDAFTASNGEMAINLIQSNGPFDLVITDLNMPRLNGVELIAWLRDRSPQTAIILMTASINAFPNLSADRIDYVINKPFKLEEFHQCLKSFAAKLGNAQN